MNESEQIPVFLDFPTNEVMLDCPEGFRLIRADGKTVKLVTRDSRKAVVECDEGESARKLAAKIKSNAVYWIAVGIDRVVRMRCDSVHGAVRGVGLSPREMTGLAKTHERVNKDTWQKQPQPSEGIFYVIRNPDGWGLYAYRYDQYPEVGHPRFWEDAVAVVLARRWSHNDPSRFRTLEADLVNSPYGFPRGRVTRTGRKYTVYHGNDLRGLIARKIIETAFDIGKRCHWEFDQHERCLRADKDGVRLGLSISEDWSAV